MEEQPEAAVAAAAAEGLSARLGPGGPLGQRAGPRRDLWDTCWGEILLFILLLTANSNPFKTLLLFDGGFPTINHFLSGGKSLCVGRVSYHNAVRVASLRPSWVVFLARLFARPLPRSTRFFILVSFRLFF